MAIRPRTGTGPGTGGVRTPQPNDERAAREAARRAEAEATLRRMAVEDTPDVHTVEAIERSVSEVGQVDDATTGAGAPPNEPGGQLGELPIDAVRLSPFQPKGRPSAEALALDDAERLLDLLATSMGRVQARVTHLKGRS